MQKLILCLIFIIGLLLIPFLSYAYNDTTHSKFSAESSTSYIGWTVIDKHCADRYTFLFVIENVLGVRKVITMYSKCTIIVGDKVNYIPQNNKSFFTESEKIERIK